MCRLVIAGIIILLYVVGFILWLWLLWQAYHAPNLLVFAKKLLLAYLVDRIFREIEINCGE